MKILGVITEDFSVYYEFVKYLKDNNIPFVSLSLKDKIPVYVGAVLTTKIESEIINFKNVIIIEKDIAKAVLQAQIQIKGINSFSKIIIGIDPGERPGIAVLGDNSVIQKEKATSPENVREIIERIIENYLTLSCVIKIGHGAMILRNRIINSLLDINVPIEIVDETNTTIQIDEPDIHAAIDIAYSKGKIVNIPFELKPTNGELNEIKRRSRLKSKGQLTISKELARKVAIGDLTLDEAINKQKQTNI